MKIGIDIDDVITDTSKSIQNYIEQYDENGEISNYMEDVMRGDMTNPTIKRFFADNCVAIFSNAQMKENANTIMQKLLEEGNEIYIITSRGEIKFKGSEKVTLNYFERHHIPYTKILWNSFEKAQICVDNQIDLMVDDSAKFCEEISEKNIGSILFTSSVNQNIPVTVPRVNSWLELQEKVKSYC